MTDRSYQSKTSAWNGNTAKMKARAAANTVVSVKELQSYILPNTMPKMVKYKEMGFSIEGLSQENCLLVAGNPE